MDAPISIAIETSCRQGGVALGRGDAILEAAGFDSGRRQSIQLVARLDELLARHGLRATDVDEAYVSVGPGSFTGLRVGVTVARTLAQAAGRLRCVAVPTVEAVADSAAGIDLPNLAVIMDAKDGMVYAAAFSRREGRFVPAGPPAVIEVDPFVRQASKPIALIGEGLGYHDLAGDGVTILDEGLWLPTAKGTWRVGRRMARAGQFTEYHRLLPIYLRKPEAVRLWERRHPSTGNASQ